MPLNLPHWSHFKTANLPPKKKKKSLGIIVIGPVKLKTYQQTLYTVRLLLKMINGSTCFGFCWRRSLALDQFNQHPHPAQHLPIRLSLHAGLNAPPPPRDTSSITFINEAPMILHLMRETSERPWRSALIKDCGGKTPKGESNWDEDRISEGLPAWWRNNTRLKRNESEASGERGGYIKRKCEGMKG